MKGISAPWVQRSRSERVDECSRELLRGGEEILFQAEKSLSLEPDDRAGSNNRLGGSDWASGTNAS